MQEVDTSKFKLSPPDDSWRPDRLARIESQFSIVFSRSSGTLEFTPETPENNSDTPNLPRQPLETTSDSSGQA